MHCFTYGSLMCADIMARATGAAFDAQPALLHGYIRHPLRGETYPAIVAQAGASVTGRLYRDLDEHALQRLDAFEGGMYERRTVTVETPAGEHLAAAAYVLRPAFAHLLGDGEWDFEAFLRHGKQHFEAAYLGFSRA